MAQILTVPRFVKADSTGQLTEAARISIRDDFHKLGYALFELDVCGKDPSRLLHGFTRTLNLGEAFVPPLYQFSSSTLYDDLGISTLEAVEGGDLYSTHPVFGSTAALALHTDGTLQEIGEISTSVLFCVERADRGGETTIFQAVEAFAALQRADSRLASALLDERALTKQASVNGSTATRKGPVFAYKAGALVTRYSVTDRDLWNVNEVEYLLDAKNALATLARPGSPYFRQLLLEAGQGVILANEKVSHGRTGFSNSTDHVRRMLRGLYARQPH